jgi:hypothetical protein
MQAGKQQGVVGLRVRRVGRRLDAVGIVGAQVFEPAPTIIE